MNKETYLKLDLIARIENSVLNLIFPCNNVFTMPSRNSLKKSKVGERTKKRKHAKDCTLQRRRWNWHGRTTARSALFRRYQSSQTSPLRTNRTNTKTKLIVAATRSSTRRTAMRDQLLSSPLTHRMLSNLPSPFRHREISSLRYPLDFWSPPLLAYSFSSLVFSIRHVIISQFGEPSYPN